MIRLKPLFLTLYAGVIAGLMLALSYACNKGDPFKQTNSDFFLNSSALSSNSDLNNSTDLFKKEAGTSINGKIGKRWIERYRKTCKGNSEYYLSIKKLAGIINNNDCSGICLFYAKNEQDGLIVLPASVNKQGEILKTAYLNTEDGTVDWATAQKWSNNYKGTIKAWFFGLNALEKLTKDTSCQVIRVSYAIDDSAQMQLLLADAAYSDPVLMEGGAIPYPSRYLRKWL